MANISAPLSAAHGSTTVRSSSASSAIAARDIGGRGLPVGDPVDVLDGVVGHAAGSERFLTTAELGDAVQHEHEMVEHALHVELDAGRRQTELIGPDAGDHWVWRSRWRWRTAAADRRWSLLDV